MTYATGWEDGTVCQSAQRTLASDRRATPRGGRKGLDHEHVLGSIRADGGVLVRECQISGCDHRVERRFIAPFVKGPEGKPLMISDKVYSLQR